MALLVILIAGASVIFLQGTTKIRFGLDLQGGTSVVLQPRVDGASGSVTAASIDQAVSIIRQRVNSLGVAESEVVAQGSGINRQIVISVPGESGERVVDLVGQTAELRFRQVLAVGSAVEAPAAPTPAPSGSKLNKSALAMSNPSPAASPIVTPNTTANTEPVATPADAQVSDELSQQFAALDCTDEKNLVGGGDDPDKPLVTCDRDGTSRFVLGPAEVLGRQVRTATAGIDQQGTGGWFVSLAFNKDGTKKFGEITQRVVSLTPPQNQVAIVLDGLVVSAPRIIDAILGGQAQITGNFTQQEASDLANVLKYGSLPLAFDRGEVQQVSPTLGSDQLRAGILAGALGLLLVIVYSFFYYLCNLVLITNFNWQIFLPY